MDINCNYGDDNNDDNDDDDDNDNDDDDDDEPRTRQGDGRLVVADVYIWGE